MYLDFSKAFDTVPHERLIKKKVSWYCGAILSWIRAWLYQRKQRVRINGVQSEWDNVGSGVPQGPGTSVIHNIYK